MASKVKKPPTMSKEIVLPTQLEANIGGTTTVPAQKPGTPKLASDGIVKKLGRNFKTLKTVPGLKKTVELKAKARVPKKVNLKINPKNFARVLMENGKGLESKKILLKNGDKEVVKKKRSRAKPPQVKLEPKESDDLPPVLEPIFPQEENVELKKKTPKKRTRKLKLPALIEIKDIKQEPVDSQAGPSEDVELPPTLPKLVKKRQRKIKTDTSTIDEVITDLSFLIDTEQIKKEIDEPNLESSKNAVKPRKITKKQRLELLKKGFIKKENIENTLNKLDPAAVRVIDRLDLNVRQFKTDLPTIKRRHSIEKFPVGALEPNGDNLMPQLSVFNQLPRSLSPKVSRKSVKLVKSRSSPYSTRSDSSSHMLRNGKHRKLKNLNLLDGVDSYKRRRRVHSDLSGSETASKLSGYESDSSFSDLASLHGSEKDSDFSKAGTKDMIDGSLDDSSNLDLKNSTATPSDMEKPLIDTNSNVCDGVEDEELPNSFDGEDVVQNSSFDEDSQSCKLIQKGLLLDKMKQTFNELGSESPLSKTFELPLLSATSVFESFHPERKVGAFLTQDMSNAASSTGDLTQKVTSMPEEDELRLLLEQTDPDIKCERNQMKEIVSTTLITKTEFSIKDQTALDDSMSLPPEADQAPVLEKQVNLDPPQNLEHLEPPILESIVEPQIARPMVDLKKPVIDDHKIGIAVTEKDNVVLFSIEHLSDDVEDLNQSFEEKASGGDAETPEDVEESAKVPINEENDAVEENRINDSEEVTKESPTSPLAPVLEMSEEPSENCIKAATEEIPPILSISNVEAPEKPDSINGQEETKTVEETKQATEKECDKNVFNSEITDTKGKKRAAGDAKKAVQKESAEELAKKESILNALGLQSLKAAKSHVYPKRKGKASAVKNDPYTGTLKTVIKLKKKKGKNSLKMTLQKNKSKNDSTTTAGTEGGYKIMKESGSGTSKQHKESSESGGAHRKSHYSNRSNMDVSSEHTSDGELSAGDKSQPEKSLIVPEKASSFSIHPGRLCKDECSYCFGKFGLFDTPCHIAQMKSVERQNKILAAEKHLTRDSCLCDACYRHVDRKSNSPSYNNKSLKRNSLVAPGPRQNHCHVLGCNNVSSNILRRKWIIKMRKSICQVINIDLDNPGLHSIPICDEHFTALEHLMICAMCKRRLARNHIHYLGPEVKDLNEALKDDGIPIVLSDKPVVCKLCKCFASIILKDPEERMENSINFFKEYKKRLLHFNDIVPMDTAAADEPVMVPSKNDKATSDKKEPEKKKKRQRNSSNESSKDERDEQTAEENESETRSRSRVASTDTNNSQSANQDSMPASPDDGDEYGEVDYNTLIPAIAMDCPSDNEGKKEPVKTEEVPSKIPRLESLGNSIEISRSYKMSGNSSKSNDLAAQKLGQNPSISLKPAYPQGQTDLWSDGKMLSTPSLSVRQLFPGEEELSLMGDVDFKNAMTRTPEGWEKCVATIQYDEETKLLWQELQKPYGSKSSFLRHLVLLEKYFRNGDLILSPTASHHAVNYRESVHNRLRAYDNIPTKAGNIQPPTMVQFNKMHNKTSGGGITNTANASNGLPPVTICQIAKTENPQSSRAPITLQQLNQPPLYSSPAVLQSLAMKNRPPGLISINQRAPAPSVVRPQMPSQKIKFPITKHWRPNLIPIEPSKKNEKKPGLVQVISGGKPYHITLEDYKKMCAIKRSFEARQKKIQEQQLQNQNSVLKAVALKKSTIGGKTSGGVMIESKPITLVPIINNASATITSHSESAETILEKLDKQVESLGKGNDPLPISAIALENNPAIQIIPRIPKSLTVIPQTVRKGPPSPILHITKSTSNGSSTGEDSNSQP